VKKFIPSLGMIVLLAGCQTTITPPAVQQPKLVSVQLNGARMCGSKVVDEQEHIDNCSNALPTIEHTFWVLSPLHLPNPARPNGLRLNRAVEFTVTTPTLTNLEVAYFTGGGQRFVLRQLAPAPDSPPIISQGSANQSVEVAMTDDGTTRTWRVVVYKGGCLGILPLEFVNVSGNGTSRSGSTKATILREEERSCVINASSGGTGAIPGVFIQSDGGPTPAPPVTQPGCSQMFKLCLTCPKGVAALAQYMEIAACSRADAFTTVGSSPLCTLAEVSSRSSCEGR
jgi:hypothetical protein